MTTCQDGHRGISAVDEDISTRDEGMLAVDEDMLAVDEDMLGWPWRHLRLG
jgi:hypothetical protein